MTLMMKWRLRWLTVDRTEKHGAERTNWNKTDGSEQNESEQNSAVGRVGLFTDSDEFLVLA